MQWSRYSYHQVNSVPGDLFSVNMLKKVQEKETESRKKLAVHVIIYKYRLEGVTVFLRDSNFI